jgi:spore coat polysaccharide biosynthesis protein SpsF
MKHDSIVLIIIQCRISSTRLPAKALLPIAGKPSAVLCAMRAGNTGKRVVIAMPTDKADDPLADILQNENIPYIRGPLEDVLKRFEMAAEKLNDDDIIVRLTADNLLPDGAFIDEMINMLIDNDYQYVGPTTRLPYGLCGEAMRAKVLREAAQKATTAEEREHVTPWIRKKYLKLYEPSLLKEDMSNIRCTMDTLEDFIRVHNAFKNVSDPIQANCWDLMRYF